jgi:acyl-CoA synthetase (AMP-forming)/AMP-acid ligase II
MGRYSPNIIATYLAAQARHNPDGEVLCHGRRRLTRRRLCERVFRLARALLDRGVGRGDKLCLMFYNTPQFVELNYAAQVAGAVPVPLNYRFTAEEVRRQLRHCDAFALVHDGRFDAVVGPALAGPPGLRLRVRHGGGTGAGGALDYERLLSLLLSRPELARVGYGKAIGTMTPSLPFFHDASYMLLMLAPMVGNLRFVLSPSASFDPGRVARTIEREQPYLLANVPTGWKRLLEHRDTRDRDLSSVRVAITGAGVCPAELKRQIFERFDEVIILDMFGQTEMTPLTSFRIDTSPATLTKERAVGRPMVPVRILDPEGRPLPPGERGEIAYRSATVMKGYYRDRQATRQAQPDGWFRSGDLGYLDADGELRILDRIKECINTGGEKVFPVEVEQVLERYPQVEAACVIGAPDATWGQAVRAVVQPVAGAAPGEAELTSHCRASLAGYKVPRSVVLVDRLPRSQVRKLLRARVRARWGQ